MGLVIVLSAELRVQLTTPGPRTCARGAAAIAGGGAAATAGGLSLCSLSPRHCC